MPTFALLTFGCKVNQYDSQAIREALARRGYTEAADSASADLYVVNTCCVTAESHRKGLRQVRRLARRHPQASIVVTGCSVDADAEAIRKMPGVRCVVANDEKPLLDAIVAGQADTASAAASPAPAWPAVSAFEGHTRAFVKIEDGCDDFCSYCIVPHVRGRVRSRPPDEVVDEVRRLVANGYLEVVLTGIHLGAYGKETHGEWALLPLLEQLVGIPGLARLRLSSLELREVRDELIAFVAASDALCPHFHIPLQSGDDAVLRAMNRRYTAADFLARVEAIRGRLPDAALTTDVIVGFPAETDEQFRNSLATARRAAFSRMHVFPYSHREGTAAERMDGKLPKDVVDARRHAMQAVAAELAETYHRRFVGRDIDVLVETRRDRRTGLLCGYSARYVRAFFQGGDELMGSIVRVQATDADARGVAASLPGGHPTLTARG
ncbi:MAG: tRNA (N(6)-L-threonylcarbamoyladenosine(37)-C(2))-methylthiotransferase MtaB [Candidatus Brocadiae bacterium]|nr:tRNA (N(6)-L-threonylcarbamoyladenosine(37)-C(2))-methylthiotransferase MtaB [Candidatus Brocadiia bacterium]